MLDPDLPARQVYGFKRAPSDDMMALIDYKSPDARPPREYQAWSHPLFIRDNVHLAQGLRPRPSAAAKRQKKKREMLEAGTIDER